MKGYVLPDSSTYRSVISSLTRCLQLACATKHGFALIEDGSALRYLSRPIPTAFQPFTRFNDGACDQKGRFVAGTLYNKGQDVPGQLYIYDPERDVCEVLDPGPFTVRCFPNDASVVFGSQTLDYSAKDCNGLGWTDGGKTMWVTALLHVFLLPRCHQI